MDGQRFDELTRALAQGTSRRRVLKGLLGTAGGGALLALGFKGSGPRPAAAQSVSCTTGTQNACPDGYVCCSTSTTPGASGTCQAVNAGGCDSYGKDGYPCTSGTENACASGFQCCTSGAPGSPGICHASCSSDTCAGAGDSCSSDGDCCAGKCSSAGVCYCSDPDRPTIGCPCNANNTSTCGGRPDLCCSDGTCASPMVGCNPTGGGGDGDPCTTGTQNPCNDGLQCCPTTTRAGGPGVCKSANSTCPAVLPNTGSGQAPAGGNGWVAPAALLGAGAALVAAKRRHAAETESE